MAIYNRHRLNQIGKLKYNTSFKSDGYIVLPQKRPRVGIRPIILDQDMNEIDVLENARKVVLEQELGSTDELIFEIDLDDHKRGSIKNENLVQIKNTIYIIREMVDDRETNITEVYCEARWYNIQYADPLADDEKDFVRIRVQEILKAFLRTTNWTVGTVEGEVNTPRTIHIDSVNMNRLQAIRLLETHCGGELEFDTVNMQVSMRKAGGRDTGASIQIEKNAKNIKRTTSTRDLITRLYGYGANDMSFESANNGLPYIENFSYTKDVRVQVMQDERYTNPYELLSACQKALDEVSKPQVSYVVSMNDLTERSGLEHEQFFIGGKVRIFDKELGLDVIARIMKWSYNISDPLESDVELEYKAKSLTDLLTGTDGLNDGFGVEDGVSNISDLSVYNHLLNSRADYGMNYWSNTGWEVDSSIGASGKASFKCNAEYGKRKELSQMVYPSTRNAYSISFQAETTDLELGGGRVGVEVVIEFEDGTTETKFIPLINNE